MQIISTEGNFYTVRDLNRSVRYYEPDYSQLRDYQRKDAEKMLEHSNGIIQLYTGYGKTWLIAWLCRYLPRPILITEPSYAMCEEVTTRLEALGIDQTDIHVLNPVGYMARLERDDSWLEKVKTLLSDETSITESMEKMLSMMKPEIMFAFTYTPDKFNNQNLSILKNYKLNDGTCKILKYFGPTLVFAKLRKPLEIVVDELHLGYCGFRLADYENWKYKKAIDICFRSNELSSYIARCIERCSSPILFPYTDHKQVTRFLTDPELAKYSICLWSAEGIQCSRGVPRDALEAVKDMTDLQAIKHLVNGNLIQVLFCSSVGFKGVDLPNLSNLILMVGSNAGNTIQIVGRVCRSDSPRIFLPKNKDRNELYEASFNKRLKWIESQKDERLDLGPELDLE